MAEITDETVWLREVDTGTDNACWVVCAAADPGSVPFTPSSIGVGIEEAVWAIEAVFMQHGLPPNREIATDCARALLSARPASAGVGEEEQLKSAINEALAFLADTDEHSEDRASNAATCLARALNALAARAGSAGVGVEELKLMREVVEAAKLMPRETPKPGAASTPHDFTIEASSVWGLDRALHRLARYQRIAARAGSKPEGDVRSAVIEECARLVELIAADWRSGGADQKVWASEYLARQIRDLAQTAAMGTK